MNKLPILSFPEKKANFSFQTRDNFDSHFYLSLYIFLISLAIIAIFLRLFQLTIVKGSYYQQLAQNNRLHQIYIEAPRGKIIDRKGLTIAESFVSDLEKNQPRITSRRQYYEKEAISHLIGYLQIADKNDLKNDPCLYKLTLGDQVGKKGVEEIFDCQLRGQAGQKIIEVNAQGKFLKTLNLIMPKSGQTIQLALDLDLQKTAYEQIKDKKGAIIGLKIPTNEVLVLTSSPGFDPENISPYLKNKDKPLLNRATEGLYPPGSIFKLVVAASALEEKKIDEKTVFEDTGILQAGPLKFGNWYYLQYGKTDGLVNVVKGIKRSNDIFFYQVGQLVGPDKIKIWAEKFGYGSVFNDLGLNQESGLIASPFWKKEKRKQDWYLGDTYNLSIGQGETLVTPLQVAVSTSVFANNGYLCQPQLLKTKKTNNCQKLPLSEKTLKLILEGMKQACAPGGTGWPLFNFGIGSEATTSAKFKPIPVACKTGTAESQSKDHLPHAWITVIAPVEKPEIVLTVLVENAGQGSDIAGPIAKEILKKYFER